MNPWKRWFRLSRIIPLLTIIIGLLIFGLSIFNQINKEVRDDFIVALLALLAFDALIERTEILGGIQERLGKMSAKSSLRNRKDMDDENNRDDFERRFKDAKEVSILAVSAVNILNNRWDLFRYFLSEKHGTLKLLLVDPSSPALSYHHMLDHTADKLPEENIKSAVETIEGLQKDNRGHCEVRKLQCVIPFSMVMIKRDNSTDIMWVEYHNYKVHYTERPHMMFRRSDEGVWFKFYEDQFKQAWKDADNWLTNKETRPRQVSEKENDQ